MREKPFYYFKQYKLFDAFITAVGLTFFTFILVLLGLKGIDFLILYVKNSY